VYLLCETMCSLWLRSSKRLRNTHPEHTESHRGNHRPAAKRVASRGGSCAAKIRSCADFKLYGVR
jgi:hypothetical protein